MIESVEITNFKSIKTAVFELDRFNVFVGSNNSGKSSVLQAIQFAVGAAQTVKKFNQSAESLFRVGGCIRYSGPSSSFLYLPTEDIEALVYNRNLTQTQGSSVKFTSGQEETEITIKRGKNRNISTSLSISPLLSKMMNPLQPFCVFTPGVSGISIREEYKSKAIVLRSATRGDSNLYLRNILLILKKQEDSWRKFIDKFLLFFPNYNLVVNFDEDNDDTIDVYVELGGVKLPIDALGTSALQILQIISYVFCFAPQILIIDEPDTHLHPNNQRKLIEVLNEISNENEMQILISSHSRHILDESSNFAKFFWMQNGQLFSSVKYPDNLIEMMLDLGAFDKNEFLNNPNIKWIICTEDAKVEKEAMLHSILDASGFNRNECIVIPYSGCSKIENAALLFSFVKKYLPSVSMIVHRDRDYLTEDEIESFSKKMLERGINLWATPGTDIEAIFVNANHIQSLYPQLSIQDINQAIQEAYNEARETSLEKYVNHVGNKVDSRNYRQINQECERVYNSNIERYSYGKKTLGLLKGKLQSKLHLNPNLFQNTTFLKQDALTEVLL